LLALAVWSPEPRERGGREEPERGRAGGMLDVASQEGEERRKEDGGRRIWLKRIRMTVSLWFRGKEDILTGRIPRTRWGGDATRKKIERVE